MNSLSRRFGVSRHAIARHRNNCMRTALAQIVSEAEQDALIDRHNVVLSMQKQVSCIQDFIDRIEQQYSTLTEILEETRLKGETYSIPGSLAAIREMRESLKLYLDLYRESRIASDESKEQQYQNYDAMMKALMEALAEYPEAMSAVMDAMKEIET